eukprot:170245-Rhodomonas_salina.1
MADLRRALADRIEAAGMRRPVLSSIFQREAGLANKLRVMCVCGCVLPPTLPLSPSLSLPLAASLPLPASSIPVSPLRLEGLTRPPF